MDMPESEGEKGGVDGRCKGVDEHAIRGKHIPPQYSNQSVPAKHLLLKAKCCGGISGYCTESVLEYFHVYLVPPSTNTSPSSPLSLFHLRHHAG